MTARLGVFNNISLDGYFTDGENQMTWAHAGADDPEFAAYTIGNTKGDGALLFGRVTYDLMAGFWPTPAARQMMPEVAARMNNGVKYVVSRRMAGAQWQNTTLLKGDLAAAVTALKQQGDADITVLGSGSIVAQLTQAGLVDSYTFVVCPVILGAGRSLFEGVTSRPVLTLTGSRSFQNGKTVLSYIAKSAL